MFRFKAHKSGTHFPIDEANGGSNFIGTFRRDHSCSTRNDKFAVEHADIFCAKLRMSRFFGITIKAKKRVVRECKLRSKYFPDIISNCMDY